MSESSDPSNESSNDPGPAASANAEASAQASESGGGMTFTSFVVGLATQALSFLGAVPGPDGKPGPTNVQEASALIDILAMLAAKTQGNLAEDEERLMEEVLYDLRMRYVEASRGAGSAPTGSGSGE